MIEITDAPIDHAAADRAGPVAPGRRRLHVPGHRPRDDRRPPDRSRWTTRPIPRWPSRRWPSSRTEARRRWPVIEVALVHRVGHLDLGEISVVVAVSCPHRHQAFDACRWLIDTLKEVVPIWKKENWADGTEEWVHPGLRALVTAG